MLLPDGHTMVLITRMMNGKHLWQASSTDQGSTWSDQRETAAWAVYPQLLTLGNGAVMLASGRPGIGLWSLDQATLEWVDFHNLAAAHNSGVPEPTWATPEFGGGRGTVSVSNTVFKKCTRSMTSMTDAFFGVRGWELAPNSRSSPGLHIISGVPLPCVLRRH